MGGFLAEEVLQAAHVGGGGRGVGKCLVRRFEVFQKERKVLPEGTVFFDLFKRGFCKTVTTHRLL